jgi:hypothetical protein
VAINLATSFLTLKEVQINMVRGTTAYFKFILPYDYDELASAQITFWQPYNVGPSKDKRLPIVKLLNQCAPSNVSNELLVSLNPEETFRFSEERKAYAQITGTTIEGNRFGRKPKEITVYPIGSNSVDDVLPTPNDDGWVILDGGYMG